MILLYILFMYLRESRAYRHNLSETFFKKLLVLGILCVIFDGATAYTVNHPDTVNPVLNKAIYTLEKDGHFDMTFEWDQALQDEWDNA